MLVEIKCFATLSRHTPEGGLLDIDPGTTVSEIMERLGIDPAEVKIMFINGVHTTPAAVLNAGDRLGLFPAVGGG